MTPNSCSNFEEKEQSRRDHNTWYQTVLQGHCNQNSLFWPKGRHIDQWNSSESPETNPSLYSQLIYDKGGKSIKWSKYSVFNKWCWGIWTAMCKKMKLDYQLIPYKKMNSRWIKDLNISHNIIKVLEESSCRMISHIPSSNILTDMSSKARDIKERINQWDLIKIKSFCMAKENSTKIQREPTVWENIFANDTSDKDLISKIYKEVTGLLQEEKQPN